ncbi:unnamed protein product [Closterium sp. NIES-54]
MSTGAEVSAPRRPTELPYPAYTARAATAAFASTATTTATAAMASPTVLTFDAEGCVVDFSVWVDDLQLFLQCDSRNRVSHFNHTSGVSIAPAGTANLSLFLRTDTTLPPFYVLVYVDDLVFATADTEALAHVKSELQKRHTCTDLAPPSDESTEPSGPYPELVGCLMYLMTCTRPDLAYPFSLLARYVAPGRHRKVHWDASKRVLRFLCSTSGMGLVLGGRARVVLTGHVDASWVDDLATQRSSQGYTFSLGSGSVSWPSTCSSSVPSSSCEAEIYAGAMAAQELRRLTYLLTDLRGASFSSSSQRGQLRLAYVASHANTADVFTKALQPCDHQHFCTVLGLVPTVPHLLTS